jgi:glutathione S-transferase
MELFFTPLSCALASRITMYEAGIPATFTRIDSKTKTTPDGRNFLEINPRGQVPVIQTKDGETLTENVSILEYLAELKPEAKLAPTGMERTRMRKWLGFVNSELHVGAMTAILSNTAPAEAKSYAVERAKKALAHVDGYLAGRQWLTSDFSVADIYLSVVSNWLQATPIKLADYPNIAALQKRVFSRPAAAKAVGEELQLYRAAA